PPSAPQNVSATTALTQATASWNAPANSGGAAVDSYLVSAYTPSGSPAGSPVTVYCPCSYPDSGTVLGLANSASYYLTVVAHNGVGNGPGVNSPTVSTPTTPSAPQAVSAQGGVTAVTATWSAPASDGGNAISSYTVNVYTSGGSLAGSR